MDPLLIGGIGAGIGGLGGALGSYFSSRGADRQAKRLRKSIRTGTFMGEQDIARQVGTAISTPEYLAATKFIRGFFGMGGDPRADLYSTLVGTFGPGATQAAGTEFDRLKNQAAIEQGLFGANYLAGRFGVGEKTIDPYISRLSQLGSLGEKQSFLEQLGSRADSKQYQFLKQLAAEGKKLSPESQAILGAGQRAEEYQSQANLYGALGNAFGEGTASPEMDALSQQFVKQIQQAQMSRGLFTGQAGAAAEAGGLAAYKTGIQMQMLPLLLQLAESPLRMANQYGPAAFTQNVFGNTGGMAAYGQANPAAFGTGQSPWASAFGGAMSGLVGGAQAGFGLANAVQQYGLNEQQAALNQQQLNSGPVLPNWLMSLMGGRR